MGLIRWEAPSGARLEILDRMEADPSRTLADLVRELVFQPVAPVDPRRLPPPGRDMAWAALQAGARFQMRLAWPRARPMLEALHEVERAAGGLPAALAAPFYALQEGAPLPLFVPVMASLLIRHRGGRKADRLRRMDREWLARSLLSILWKAEAMEPALEAFGDLPASGTDAVGVAATLGRKLWDPAWIPADPPSPLGFGIAGLLAMAVGGAGQGPFPWPVRDWVGWLDWLLARRRGRPDPPADWPPQETTYLGGPPVDLPAAWSSPPPLALGLARALIRAAAEEARYVPAGRFRIRLPELAAFRGSGVTVLRVAADPHGLWIRLAGERGEGEFFRFEPDLPPRPDLAIDGRWWAAAAALWHDLCVGIPRRPARRPGGERPPSSSAESPPAARQGSGVVILPRPFVVREDAGEEGEAEPEAAWGEEAERAHVLRTAHVVRGHLRRLREGWRASPEAQAIAAAFGVVIPEGYTFVRPHARGGRGEEPAGEREAVARGLRSLALLG